MPGIQKTMKARMWIMLALIGYLPGNMVNAQKMMSEKGLLLFSAIEAGNLSNVQVLVETDSMLMEIRDNDGNTPLRKACTRKKTAIAHYLIDKGANIKTKNNDGFTPLHGACSGPIVDETLILHLLNKGADINARTGWGITPMHLAVNTGDPKVLKLLIDHGARLDIYDRGGYGTVLHMAINLGQNQDMVKLLIDNGATLHKYSYGNTELHLAALKGYSDMVPLLVKHGADVNAVNRFNHTALFYAARQGYRQTANALIAAGANDSTIGETNYGKSPQLSQRLKKGEAYLWYMGGLYGGGYAIKTRKNLIIFDETAVDEAEEAGLANGHLNPTELANQHITVFVTKALGLKFERGAFGLANRLRDVRFILDADPTISNTVNAVIPPYRLAAPNETFTVGDIRVHAIQSMNQGHGGAIGLGYLVETDGLKIVHAGFHACNNSTSEMERYRQTIDLLKPLGPIDIVILTVNGHLDIAYEPYLYLLDQLSPNAIYLGGGDAATEEYARCADIVNSRAIPVNYPEGGRAMGERYHYLR